MITIVQRIQGVLTPNPSLDDAQTSARAHAFYAYGLFFAITLLVYIVLSALNGAWLVYPSGRFPSFMLAFSLLVGASLWHKLSASQWAIATYAVGILTLFYVVGTFKNGLLAYPLLLLLFIVARHLLPRHQAWRFFIPLALFAFGMLLSLPEQALNLALHYWLASVYLFLMIDVSLANPTSTLVERSRAVFDRLSSVAALFVLLLAMLQWVGWLQGSVLLNGLILLVLGGLFLLRRWLSAKHFGVLLGTVLAIFHTYAVSTSGEIIMPYIFVYFFLGAMHLSVKYYAVYAAILSVNQYNFLLTQSELPLHGTDVVVNFGVLFVFFCFAMYLVKPLFIAGVFGARQRPLLQWLLTHAPERAVLARFAYLLVICHAPLVILLWLAQPNTDVLQYMLGWPGFFWLLMLWLIMGLMAVLMVRREVDLNEMLILRKKAEQHNRSQGALLANINHDIRTPLNNLSVTLQGLRADSSLSPEQQEYLHIMHCSAHKLSRLMGDMIDVSHIESGKVEFVAEAIYLPTLVAEWLVSHDHQAADNGVSLLCDTQQTPPIWVQVDPLRLTQVLSNLITNAIKFSPGGSVTLDVSVTAEGVMFRVADNGAGMDEATLNRVFNRFEQADNSMTRQYQGLGLGLSICRDLVSLMGGHLKAQSVEGKGSTFTVVLPLPIVDEVKGMAVADMAPHHIDLSQSRLLVVEDDFVSRKVLETALCERVETLTLVSSGEQALQALSVHHVDVVLTDIAMPGMSGVELLHAMRAQGYHMPVMAFTGNALAEEVTSYRAAGFDAVMSKPLDTKTLLDTLQSLLRQQRRGEH